MTNARLHLCRLSSLESVEIVRKAKKQGLRITADVGVHYLHLTDLDVGDFNTNCKAIPPFRGQRDRDALIEGLLDGTIDFICSDHTPVDIEEKTL
ncbi:MAG: dihydroorotase, partial [Rhodobacteraceae bacterium]|nr:dihydroorotase [Paracoccaceae bacterium]